MKSTITIIIADDHEIYRDGLTLMLSKQKDVQLVAQASNGEELIGLVAQHQPDVVLTDIKMPEMDGIAATQEITRQHPRVKIIALSMFDEENLIVEMLEAGAKGYLLKNSDKQEIMDAIHNVTNNNIFYCKSTSAKLAAMIVKSRFGTAKKEEEVTFSDREIEVIKLICQQCTAQEIGDQLFLSRRTVEGYRTRILEKMNVKNTAGIVIYALRHHLIEESEIM